MVPPGSAGRSAFTRGQLVEAAPAGTHDRTRRSIWTSIRCVRYSIEILIGRSNFDVLENRGPGIGRNSRRIDDLQVAADRGAGDDPLFEIAELQGWALQTSGCSLGEINDRIL